MRERIGREKNVQKQSMKGRKGKSITVVAQGRMSKDVRALIEKGKQGRTQSPSPMKSGGAAEVSKYVPGKLPKDVSMPMANAPENAADPQWLKDRKLRDQLAEDKAKLDPVVFLPKRGRKLSHSKIITALAEAQGYVTVAATRLQIGYRTLRKIIDGSEKLQEIMEYMHEARLDRAEYTVHKKAANEDLTAAMFVLRTQGKGRGYVEDQKGDMQKMLQPVTIIYASPKRVEQQSVAALPEPEIIEIQPAPREEVQQTD